MHAAERERLRRLVVRGRRRPAGAEAAAAVRALRVTGVDIACVARHDRAARRVLARAGYADGFRAAHLRCERAPASALTRQAARLRPTTSRYSYGYSAGPPAGPWFASVAKARKSRSSSREPVGRAGQARVEARPRDRTSP